MMANAITTFRMAASIVLLFCPAFSPAFYVLRQREEMKKERRQISREEREAEAQRRFEMKQAKKKEKKRGH